MNTSIIFAHRLRTEFFSQTSTLLTIHLNVSSLTYRRLILLLLLLCVWKIDWDLSPAKQMWSNLKFKFRFLRNTLNGICFECLPKFEYNERKSGRDLCFGQNYSGVYHILNVINFDLTSNKTIIQTKL